MGFAQQETLVEYKFDSNSLAGTSINPDLQTAPSLKYYNSTGIEITPNYDNFTLRAVNSGDYLEILIDTRTFSNISVSFDGFLRTSGVAGAATWNLNLNPPDASDPGPFGVLLFTWFLDNNDQGSLTKVLPGLANNNQFLRLRIEANTYLLLSSANLRIDNIKITAGNPNINVYTGTPISPTQTTPLNTAIPDGSLASTALTTDFGVVQTSGPAVDRVFRIRNVKGSANLVINNITSVGNAANDFAIIPVNNPIILTTQSVTGNPYSYFTVSFLPLADGLRTSEIEIKSNAGLYKFKVIGMGASCKLDATNYVKNNLDISEQDLDSNLNQADLMYGNSTNATSQNSLNMNLYPSANDLFATSLSSWYVKGDVNVPFVSKEIEFGGDGDVILTDKKNVSIEFRVAAFTTALGSDNKDPESGLNSNSYISLEVSKNGGSFVEQIRLKGSNRADRFYRYGFGNSNANTLEKYNALRIPAAVRILENRDNTGPNAYNIIRLNIPTDQLVNVLKFKIKAVVQGGNRMWLIDDVKVNIDNAIFKTYTIGGAWVPSEPMSNEKALVEGNLVLGAGLYNVCECEVASTGSVTLQPSANLTVRGKIINNNLVGNNFIVSSDANLMQIEDAALNYGAVTVHRTAPMKKNNYTYWGSPVTGRKLQDFSPGTTSYRFYEYIESTNLFQTVPWGNNFIPGKGYAIMAPSNYTLNTKQDFDGAFVGIPNNGTNYQDTPSATLPLVFPVSLTAGADQGYNLVGNPYPSNIDFEKLYADNSSVIYNTAYFWTNVDPNRAGSTNGNTGYAGNAYAIYNGVGGIAATGPATGPGGTSPTPTQFIKVGQGFIVKAKNAGSLTFKNSIRNATGSSAFFSKGAASDRDRFWVKLTTPVQDVNTVLIGYVPNATDDFEWDYDAPLFSIGSDSFYSMLGEEKLGIQGRTYPLNTADVVRLGTKHFEDGIYTIGLGDKEGIFAGSQAIYLNDKQTGTITNLSEGDYVFTANVGESQNRFELIYKPQIVLVTDSTVKEGFIVYRDQDHFIIQSPKVINEVEVYDSAGKLIKVLNTSAKKAVLDGSFLPKGMYVIRIKTIDGEINNRKILK